jgi:hypothetical protein
MHDLVRAMLFIFETACLPQAENRNFSFSGLKNISIYSWIFSVAAGLMLSFLWFPLTFWLAENFLIDSAITPQKKSFTNREIFNNRCLHRNLCPHVVLPGRHGRIPTKPSAVLPPPSPLTPPPWRKLQCKAIAVDRCQWGSVWLAVAANHGFWAGAALRCNPSATCPLQARSRPLVGQGGANAMGRRWCGWALGYRRRSNVRGHDVGPI